MGIPLEEHAECIPLNEGCLNDDEIQVLHKGYKFNRPGRTCTVRVIYWTYATEWSNKRNEIYATSIEEALAKYKRVRPLSQDIEEDVYNYFSGFDNIEEL